VEIGFISWHVREIFFFLSFLEKSRLALRPTHHPMQWYLVVKQPGHEADHSLPSKAKVKSSGAILPLPHMSSMCGP
jgi:hypothetical protein